MKYNKNEKVGFYKHRKTFFNLQVCQKLVEGDYIESGQESFEFNLICLASSIIDGRSIL